MGAHYFLVLQRGPFCWRCVPWLSPTQWDVIRNLNGA